ncbi:MAG TPA: DinB family protein [Xanthobacteraceae bacterium]|jgi:uncharacterized damage-inducible protein DinB
MMTPQSSSEALVSQSFVRIMAAYNAEMNRRIYAAAGRLPDSARWLARGAFWGSIHGTLCHLLWGDQMWMSRFDAWPKPNVGIKESATLIADFQELSRARCDADARISSWAERVSEAWLAEEQVWFSMAANREQRQRRSLLVTHLFNHQTHHRGQVHAMITACGEQTGDTDLFLVVGNS